ncbi:hypothetical protein GCM10027521_53380 [Amycolatopsis cihanbeyliensis]
MVGVCVLSMAVCGGLAWWQWERFASASGSFQNLGYVLQWPLFGLFPAFVFWRLRRLAKRATPRAEAPTSGREEWGHAPAQVPEQRPNPPAAPSAPDEAEEADDELAAYNRYLAELHARDQENSR